MPTYLALAKYWADHPPTHLLLAAFLGVKPKSKVNTPAEIEALMRMFPPTPGSK